MVFTIELEYPSKRNGTESKEKILKINSRLYLLIKKIRHVLLHNDNIPRPLKAFNPSIQLLNPDEDSEEIMDSRIKELFTRTSLIYNLHEKIDWYEGSIVILLPKISGYKKVPCIEILPYPKISMYNQIKIIDLCKNICLCNEI